VFAPGDATGFEVQASTNRIDWLTLPTYFYTQGADRFGFFDTFSTDCRQRFYRVLSE